MDSQRFHSVVNAYGREKPGFLRVPIAPSSNNFQTKDPFYSLWAPARCSVYSLILLVALILLGSTRTHAEDNFSVAYLACAAADPNLRPLCASFRQLQAQPTPFAIAEPAAALEVYAQLLTEAGPDPKGWTSTARARAVMHELRGNSAALCGAIDKAVEQKLGSGADWQSVAATACLRPSCLLPPPPCKDHPCKKDPSLQEACATIPEAGRESLRLLVTRVIQTIGPTLGCPSFVADSKSTELPTNPPLCIREDAAESIVWIDQHAKFFGTLAESFDTAKGRSAACVIHGNSDECRKQLEGLAAEWLDLGRVWSEGAALNQAFEASAALATQLDSDLEFRKAWANVEKAEKSPGAAFPFEHPFVESLQAASAAVTAVRERFDADLKKDFTQLWKRGSALAAAILATERAAGNTAIDAKLIAFATDWNAQFAFEPSALLDDAKRAQLSKQKKSIEAAEEGLRKWKVSSALLTPTAAPECTPESAGKETSIDWDRGSATYCWKRADAVGPIGLKFSFAPCLDQTQPHSCNTKGSLQLLIRLPSTPAPTPALISIPLGVNEIDAQLRSDRFTLLRLPPQSVYRLDPDSLKSTLARLLPAPFHLQTLGSLDLENGLVVEIHGVEITFAGFPLEPFTLRITSEGTQIVVGTSTFDTLGQGLRVLLDRTMQRATAKGDVQLPGLPFTVSTLRLLHDGEPCKLSEKPTTGEKPQSIDRIELCAVAQLPLPLLDAPLTTAIQWSVSDGNITWRIAEDEQQLQSRLNALLSHANRFTAEAVDLLSDNPTLALQEKATGCAIQLPLHGNPTATIDKALQECMQRKLDDALQTQIGEFSLFGLNFSQQAGQARACVPAHPKVCVRGVRLVPLDFSGARLDDGGELSRIFREELLATVPGTTAIRAIELGSHPSITVTVQLPVLGSTDIELANDSENQFRSTVNQKIMAEINTRLLKSPSLQIGGAQVKFEKVKTMGPDALTISGSLEYAHQAVRMDVEILPHLGFDPVDLDKLAPALINLIDSNWITGQPAFHLELGPDRVPVLKSHTSLTLPFGLKAEADLEARPGDSRPRIIGPVSVTMPEYYTIATAIDAGAINAQIDPMQPGNFLLGASVALTPGATSQDALRLTGTLGYQGKDSVLTLDSKLLLADAPVAQANGRLLIPQKRIEMSLSPEGAAANLPLPRADVILDADACLTAGKVSVNVLQSIELLNADAIIILPASACTPHKRPEEALGQTFHAPACFKDWQTGNGLICVDAHVILGALGSADATIKTPILSMSPNVDARFEVLGFVTVETNVNIQRVSLNADLKVLSVKLILPNVTSMTHSQLESMLSALLKPSIDLDAIRRGQIVIAPSHGKKGENDSTGQTAEQLEGGQPQSQSQPQPPAPGAPKTGQPGESPPVVPPVPPPPGPAPPPVAPLKPDELAANAAVIGADQLKTRKLADGTYELFWARTGGVHETSLLNLEDCFARDAPSPTKPFPPATCGAATTVAPRVSFATATALSKTGTGSLTLIQNSPVIAGKDNRHYLLMCQDGSCVTNKLVAVPVAVHSDSLPEDSTLQPLSTLPTSLALVAPDHSLTNPPLAGLIAMHVLRGTPLTSATCIGPTSNPCSAAAVVATPAGNWLAYVRSPDWTQDGTEDAALRWVDEGSLWQWLLSQPPSDTTRESLRSTLDSGIEALAFPSPSSAAAGPVATLDCKQVTREALVEYASTGQPGDRRKITSPRLPCTKPWESRPTDLLTDRLMRETVGKPQVLRWSVFRDDDSHPRRALLMGADTQDKLATLSFGLKAAGKNIICTAPFAEVNAHLARWAKPGDFDDAESGRLGSNLFERLMANSQELADQLVTPKLGDGPDAFHVDPALLFYPSTRNCHD